MCVRVCLDAQRVEGGEREEGITVDEFQRFRVRGYDVFRLQGRANEPLQNSEDVISDVTAFLIFPHPPSSSPSKEPTPLTPSPHPTTPLSKPLALVYSSQHIFLAVAVSRPIPSLHLYLSIHPLVTPSSVLPQPSLPPLYSPFCLSWQ